MSIIKFLALIRFNYIDLVGMASAVTLASQGKLLSGIAAFGGFAMASMFVEAIAKRE
jgi:hypothetical protein